MLEIADAVLALMALVAAQPNDPKKSEGATAGRSEWQTKNRPGCRPLNAAMICSSSNQITSNSSTATPNPRAATRRSPLTLMDHFDTLH